MTHALISITDFEKEKFLRGCVNQITKLVWQKVKRQKEESVFALFQVCVSCGLLSNFRDSYLERWETCLSETCLFSIWGSSYLVFCQWIDEDEWIIMELQTQIHDNISSLHLCICGIHSLVLHQALQIRSPIYCILTQDNKLTFILTS